MTPRSARWYRLLTLAYPRRWRRQHGDELVGSLLDLVDQEGRRRPALRDVLDVLVHGLASRARMPVDALPAATRSAAGTLGLASGAGTSLVLLAGGARPDPTTSAGPVVYGAWLLALLAAVAGLRSLARAVLAGTTAVGAAVPVVLAVTPLGAAMTRPTLTILGFLTLCGLLALLGPPPAARPVLVPAVAAAALVAGPLLPYRLDWTLSDHSFYSDLTQLPLALSALVVAALLAAVAVAVRGSTGAGTALAALPWLAFGLALLTGGARPGEAFPALLTAAAVVLLGAVVIRRLGLRLRIERVPVDR